MSERLTPGQLYERDVRLYGLTVARWLEGQRKQNLGLSVPALDDKRGSKPLETLKRPIPSADKPLPNIKSVEAYLK